MRKRWGVPSQLPEIGVSVADTPLLVRAYKAPPLPVEVSR